MAHLNVLVENIQQLEQTQWCIHEVQFAKRIGIKATTEQTAAGQVTELCSFLKRGGCGNRQKGSFVNSSVGKIDINAGSNSLNLQMWNYGEKELIEEHDGLDDVFKAPRWFRVGSECVTSPHKQSKLLAAIIGENITDVRDEEVVRRRRKNYLAWYKRESNDAYATYESKDLPSIAFYFREFINCENVHQKRNEAFGFQLARTKTTKGPAALVNETREFTNTTKHTNGTACECYKSVVFEKYR